MGKPLNYIASVPEDLQWKTRLQAMHRKQLLLGSQHVAHLNQIVNLYSSLLLLLLIQASVLVNLSTF
jgi:hypothetical protein